MKSVQLQGQLRTDLGKNATKALRNNDLIPSSIYGGEANGEAIHFTLSNKEVRKVIYTPDVYMIELELGGKTYKSIVKEIQFHPVTDAILHLDFLHIYDDRPMIVELPVALNGLAAGVRAGGRLTSDMRKLKVKGLLKDMPEKLDIDVTKLELGTSIQVGELNFAGLEILNAPKVVVCRVRLTRAAKGAAAAAASESK